MDARAKWAEVRALDKGSLTLGPNTADRYLGDPKRIGFMLSRYKFAAKMLRDCETIVDLGCGDGFGTVTFLSDTDAFHVLGVDFDRDLIHYAAGPLCAAIRETRPDDWPRIGFRVYDFMADIGTALTHCEGVVSLDVWEHIDPEASREFVARLHGVTYDGGIAVVGAPSTASAQFASAHSAAGHINLKTPDQFYDELSERFHRVLMFSMNDEMVHTGFDKLAHYLIGVCIA